ncbi:hypothetical protein cbdbA708 [Dehalococcoides mccartyi CBDB1]|uniref:Uncharacterized protein n=1 Tax=Dehalococcoides mccartyi (strain CBDB1) TaxID=255470 RepID=A0A916KMB7_DEHMC|nr:hypothetical protein cbdbA708 [Dehalococcoides mccartyi CBDB1]
MKKKARTTMLAVSAKFFPGCYGSGLAVAVFKGLALGGI